MMYKKIAIVINSMAMGGAERVVSILITELEKRGIDVELICLEHELFYKIPQSLRIIFLSKGTSRTNYINKIMAIPWMAWKLRSIMKERCIGYSISFLQRADYVNILAKLFGAGHIANISVRATLSEVYSGRNVSDMINIALIKILYPYADNILAPSYGILDGLRVFVKDSFRSHVIPNPVDMASIMELSARKPMDAFEFRQDKRYIVCVGRLIKLKRIDLIIQTLKSFDDVDLIIIGDGEEFGNLMLLSKTIGLSDRVHFMGKVDNPFWYIKNCDAFVMASTTEGFPNVLVEAMACGVPVVSSDCSSGPREILAPNTDSMLRLSYGIEQCEYGILVAVNCLNGLVEALGCVLGNEEKLLSMKKAALKRVKDFDKQNIVNQYIEFLKGA